MKFSILATAVAVAFRIGQAGALVPVSVNNQCII